MKNSNKYIMIFERDLSVPRRFQTNEETGSEFIAFGHYSNLVIYKVEGNQLFDLWQTTTTAIEECNADESKYVQPFVFYPQAEFLAGEKKDHITPLDDYIKRSVFCVISLISVNPDLIYNVTDNGKLREEQLQEIVNNCLLGEDYIYGYTLGCCDHIIITSTSNPSLTMNKILRLQSLCGDLKATTDTDMYTNKRIFSYTYSTLLCNRTLLNKLNNRMLIADSLIVQGVIGNGEAFSAWTKAMMELNSTVDIQPGRHNIMAITGHISADKLRKFLKICEREFKGDFDIETSPKPLASAAFTSVSFRLNFAFEQTTIDDLSDIGDVLTSHDSLAYHNTKYIENWKAKLNKDSAICKWAETQPGTKRILMSLITAVRQIALCDSTYTLFWSTANAIDLFFDLLEKKCQSIIDSQRGEDGNTYTESSTLKQQITEFVIKIDDIFQCATHSHRHQMEAPDVHIKYYEVYSKLFALYVGFCNEMRDALLQLNQESSNGDGTFKNNYQFFLSLQPQNYVSIDLWNEPSVPIDNNELLIIAMPEVSLFKPVETTFQLLHEVVHFVGVKYRKRESRAKCWINALAASCAVNLLRDFESRENWLTTDSVADYLRKSASSNLEKMRPNQYSHKGEADPNLFYASRNIEQPIINATALALNKFIENGIFEIAPETSLRKNPSEFLKLYRRIQRQGQTILVDLYSYSEPISYVFEEAFADIVALQLLDISDPKEYLRFYQANDGKYHARSSCSANPMHFSKVGIRLHSVINCLNPAAIQGIVDKNYTPRACSDTECDIAFDTPEQFYSYYYHNIQGLPTTLLSPIDDYISCCYKNLKRLFEEVNKSPQPKSNPLQSLKKHYSDLCTMKKESDAGMGEEACSMQSLMVTMCNVLRQPWAP